VNSVTRRACGALDVALICSEAWNRSFSATVQGMKSGERPNQRSLMPTCLKWIAARKELWLWWGSAVSAFAVAMSILRWLKITA
jgi:hypothetical protein